MNDAQITLLRDIVWHTDHSGVRRDLYPRTGNTLRALARRGYITFTCPVPSGEPTVYEAVATQAGREAVAS